MRHVQSTDYRHDRPHISHSISCAKCSSAWRLDHGILVECSSEAPYLAAKAQIEQARATRLKIARELIQYYFAGLSFSSKKAELEYLQQHNLCGLSLAAYRKERAKGRTVAEIANGLGNLDWLQHAAREAGRANELSASLALLHDAERIAEIAARQVVRQSVKLK